jgi:ion channel-forming bestrophin family protein
MIQYNPKDWLTFIFKFHKSDTVRKLAPLLLVIGIYTAIVEFVFNYYSLVKPDSLVKNLSIMHTLLGAVISLLLVFRTNTAYDRWWEGRKLWGALVNTSRSIAIKFNAILPAHLNSDRVLIEKLITFFPFSLRAHLIKKTTADELFDMDEFENVLPPIDAQRHIPNQVISYIFSNTIRLKQNKVVDENELLILNEDIRQLSDITGACERIKNTPIPYSYAIFLKKFIFFYVMTLPFAFISTLSYLAIPVVMFIFYVLASLEIIAEEIEDPFGEDTNDLPMQKLSENIQIAVRDIFSKKR